MAFESRICRAKLIGARAARCDVLVGGINVYEQ